MTTIFWPLIALWAKADPLARGGMFICVALALLTAITSQQWWCPWIFIGGLVAITHTVNALPDDHNHSEWMRDQLSSDIAESKDDRDE